MNIKILTPLTRVLIDVSLTEICLNRDGGLGSDEDEEGPEGQPKAPRPAPSPATV